MPCSNTDTITSLSSPDPDSLQGKLGSLRDVVRRHWLFQENRRCEWLRRIFFSIPTDICMGIIVLVNVFTVIEEVDAASLGQEVPSVHEFLNRSFVFVYLAELLLRFYLLRLTMFKDPYTVIDAVVVNIDLAVMVFLAGSEFKNASIVRVFRLAKLARSVHLMEKAPELHLMMKGIFGAVKSIIYGSILACAVMVFWSILAVEFIQPKNDLVTQSGYYNEYPCPRCERAYKTVWESFHTFVRIVICGDSWGVFTEPIVDEDPLCMVFFLMVYASINYVVLNMILAVIIDSAQEARTLSTQELAEEKEKYFVKAQKRLIELCGKLDRDGDGMLTMHELDRGFRSNIEFSNILKALGIKHQDMPIVFGVMDADDSGTVSFQEFVTQLYTMQKNDTQGMLMHLRFYLQQVLRSVKDQLDNLTCKLTTEMAAEENALEKKISDARTSISNAVVSERKRVEVVQDVREERFGSAEERYTFSSESVAENNLLSVGRGTSSHSSLEKFRSEVDTVLPRQSSDQAKANDIGCDLVGDLSVKLNDVHASILKLLSQVERPLTSATRKEKPIRGLVRI